MDSDAEMMERHARLLGRFAEQAAGLAEDLYVAALAAESPTEKQSLSFAFHRMGRTLRQTCALEAKLRRDARREDRLDQQFTQEVGKKAAEARVAGRKGQLARAVQQLIWTEAEDETESDAFKSELDDRLDLEALDAEAFLSEPVETQIARICAAIGLEVPADPPPLGEVSPKATEGASAVDSQRPCLSGPAQSLRDSSPPRGASGVDDPISPDDDWRSSA
jgi:hypothetical protein